MLLLGVTRQYADHLVIVATDCYMRTEGRDTGCASGYETASRGGQMWQEFIRKQLNIVLVSEDMFWKWHFKPVPTKPVVRFWKYFPTIKAWPMEVIGGCVA